MTAEITTKTNLADIPDSKPNYVPKSTYWHRIKEVEFKMSKSANQPMYEIQVEIVDHPGYPDPKTPGAIIDVNGTETTMWQGLTEKSAGFLKTFFRACGIPLEINLHDLTTNPNTSFLVGKKFLAIGYSKPDVQVDEVTKQPIKNPLTGQDVVFYQYKIGQIFPQS